MESFTKQSWEKYEVAFDFYGRLPVFSSLTLVSGTVAAIDESDSSNATSVVLQSATMTVPATNKLLAVFGVQAGVSGKSYKLTARVVASDGSQFEEDIRMVVADE